MSLALVYVNAKSYGGYGGEALALPLPLPLNTGYAAPALRALPVGPVNAAIQSTRTVEYIPLAVAREAAAPQVIEVEPFEQPVQLIFRSSTSPVLVEQVHHQGQPQQHEATRSEEQPSHLRHEVYKPVIQEFHETVQPFRRIVQEVKPVIEEVRTVVAKGEGYRAAPLLEAQPLLVKEEPLLAKKY